MNVQLAVLADAANVAPPGKLNIMGIFDSITATNFPAVHPSMVLAVRLRFDYDDGSGQHEFEIVLRDEDGKDYMRAKAVAQIPQIKPGEFTHVNQVLNFAQMAFGKAGRYAFHLIWDGEEKARVELMIVQRQQPPTP